MSAFSNNAILHMPWSYSDEEDGRFNRIVRTSLAVSLVFSILIPLLPLTIIEKEIIEEPPRLVTLIFEKKEVTPPPKPKPVVRKPRPLPKKAEKPKPVKQVKKIKKPAPVDKTVAARFDGRFDPDVAAAIFTEHLEGAGDCELLVLTDRDRHRIFNLGYFTWVEQQGVELADFEARRSQDFWLGLRELVPLWDGLIDHFNTMSRSAAR